jgi:DNA-binding NarL/FixJ family response regulator
MTRRRVLLADDHPLLLRGLADLVALESDFELVGSTTSGLHALQMIRDMAPELAVLDVTMPDMDGLAILRKVSREELPVRTVFLTATITPAQISEALALNVWGMLLKESAPDALVDCLRAAASGERWLPEELLARAEGERRGGANPLLRSLTPREREIVDLASRGLSNKAIAATLGSTEGTVKIHLHNIYQKVEVPNRTALVALNLEMRDRAPRQVR